MPIQTIGQTTVLRLRGSPEDMGEEHGTLLRESIPQIVDQYVHGSQKLYDVPTAFLLARASECEEYIPRRFLRELRAIAGASQTPYQELLAFNCLPDIDACHMHSIFHCCNFVVSPPCTKEGIFLHGRNLDFPPGDKTGTQAAVVISRTPNDSSVLPTAAICWAGDCGMLTGCNAECVTLAEVSTPAKDDSLSGVPIGFLMRDALERSTNVDQVAEAVASSPRTSGYNLATSDGKTQKSLCIESTHSLCETRHPRRGMLVVDDVCLCKGTGRNRLLQAAGAFRFARMVQLLRKHYGHVDVSTALEFLKDRHDMSTGNPRGRSYNCICNYHTVQSVLLLPSKRRMLVSHRHVPAPLGQYSELTFGDLW